MAAKRTTTWAVVVGGLLVALGLAFFVSRFASSSPDGLNKVAIDQGFDDTETNHATADGPFAGYGVKGVDDQGLSTGLAGIVGVVITFGIGLLLFVVVGRRKATGWRARCRGGDRLVRLRTVSGAHALFVHGDSLIHRLRPECKLLAQVLFVFAVVATPREAFWAFGVYVVMLVVLTQLADLTVAFVAKRLVIEVPFVLFAVFLPLIGQGRADRGTRSIPVGRRSVGDVEHPDQGHDRRRGQRDPGGHHARPGLPPRLGAAAPAVGVHVDHGVHDPVLRGHLAGGPAHEGGAGIPWLRRPVALAGEGVRGLGRRAVHPVLRARRTGAPGHDLPRLRRSSPRGR